MYVCPPRPPTPSSPHRRHHHHHLIHLNNMDEPELWASLLGIYMPSLVSHPCAAAAHCLRWMRRRRRRRMSRGNGAGENKNAKHVCIQISCVRARPNGTRVFLWSRLTIRPGRSWGWNNAGSVCSIAP